MRESKFRRFRRRFIWLCDGDHYDPRLLWIWQRCECGQWRRDEMASRARLRVIAAAHRATPSPPKQLKP